MASAIDEGQVRHIAKLARLSLSDDEVHQFAGQLGGILEYVRQLDAVDTTGVQPMAHPSPVTDVLRADEPGAAFDADRALENAPQREGRFFKVPPVLDQGSGA